MTLHAPIGGADTLRDDDLRHIGSDPAAPRLVVDASYLMAQGTGGNDFIHVAGDGMSAPAGYADDPSATAGDDSIDISQGGNDEVFSGAGNDVIHAGAALTGADIVDGGADVDGLYLDGDYTGAHALTLSNVFNIEGLSLAAGHGYTLTAADAALGAGQSLAIDATALAAGDVLIFDGSAELDGKFDINSGAGNDILTGGAGNDTFRGQDGNDTINGGDGNDILIGNAGNDILNGGNNDDALFGGAGNDTIDGGAGYDTVYSDSDTLGFTASLVTGVASGAGIGSDTLSHVEAIQGGSGNDHLTGDDNDNHLYGNGGSNTLSGGGGHDSLFDTGTGGAFDGGDGSDFLYLVRTALGASDIHFTSGSTTAQTLSDGTSFVNVEALCLFSGDGDDSMTYVLPTTHPGPDDAGAGTWEAGGGINTMTVDMSGFDTAVQAFSAGDPYEVADKGYVFLYGYHIANVHVLTGNGDDFFNGTAGDDSFDGGGGINMAGFFHGAHTDYAIAYDAGTQSFTIADQRVAPADPDGTDTLKNTQLFQFTDGVFTFDTLGRVTSQTVSDGGDGANMTMTDVAGTAAWSTQVIHSWEGVLASQTVTTDAGAQWINSYDYDGTHSWTWTSDSYDATGGHLTQSGTNDDGTHWLTIYSPSIPYGGYSDITLTFDANWNQTGLGGHNGTDPLTMARIAPLLDTVLWFATPYDPDAGGAAAGGYGLGGAGIYPYASPLSLGGDGIDILYGFGGDDWLEGGGGNDYLNGGTGNDTLVGGTGDDRFVFKFGDGLDTIRDFAPGNAAGDVIDLHDYGIATFAALTPFMTQVGADTLIAFDDQNHIVLHNVALAQLNAGDFVLS